MEQTTTCRSDENTQAVTKETEIVKTDNSAKISDISPTRKETEKTYRCLLDILIDRAKLKDPKSDGLPLGEKFFVELLRFYIFQFRINQITAEELNRKKTLLERDLVNYWDSKKMFKKSCEIRNKQSQWLIKAEKQGCEICRKLVRIFDGREQE